jgi:hypothetical protein
LRAALQTIGADFPMAIFKETYKGNEITVATWYLLDTAQWKPLVTMIEMKTARVSAPIIDSSFPTEREALLEGLLFAKKWIDDEKPPL